MKNKHKATLIFLIVGAAVLWWYAPTIASIPAMRPVPQLPQPQPMATAPAPIVQPAYVEPAQAAPQAPQATAVPTWPAIEPPVVATMAPAPAPVLESPTLPPVPTMAAPQATAVPTLARVEPLSKVAETYTLTTGEIVPIATAEFYTACAYAQAKGLRSRPDCPPRAAELLGSGR